MSITAVNLTTRLRTWLLVAALTALLVGVGAVIGGTFLYVFVGLAVAMNLAGYWFSDRVALAASRARPLPDGAALGLRATVAELAGRAGVPVPRLFLIESEQPNAFATGRDPAHAALAVTTGLLASLPPDQIRAVVAHELGHVRNRDILVASVAAMIAGAVAMIANVLQLSFLFGGESDDDSGPLAWVGLIAAIVIGPIAATLLQLGVSRQREYLADATAAELLGDGAPLAAALETLERRATAQPLAVNPAVASLYIVNPLSRRGLSVLFSTHPPAEERIRRLRGYRVRAGRAASDGLVGIPG
jgi:heat shock protein HtpX